MDYYWFSSVAYTHMKLKSIDVVYMVLGVSILINNHNFIEAIESENMTSASYNNLAIISKNK